MAEVNRCTECGTPLESGASPQGHCPRCLLELGLERPSQTDESPPPTLEPSSVKVGASVHQFQILEKIGHGGMGEIYLAQDTSLDRKVALKFLPEDMQQDETARLRFLREARSAAAIDHPYICNIYEIGEIEGEAFIAMEYVPGLTLQERLADGPLPLPEALQLAAEISEAMEEAHKRNIIHRDLKPSNVMLTEGGHVKVMDFGLAKRVDTEAVAGQDGTLTGLTKEGSTLGTLPYMSPEQIRGRKLDARSDIFSFGVLLYETLTGVHPFRKPQPLETAGAILKDEPTALARYRSEIPERVQYLVEKMLAKDPEQRYQSVQDVGRDLRRIEAGREPVQATSWMHSWWGRTAAGLVLVAALVLSQFLFWPSADTSQDQLVRLAVLPFRVLTPLDESVEGILPAVTENLIFELRTAAREKLYVSPAVSVLPYSASTQRDLSEISRELGVNRVWDLTIQQIEDMLTINSQVIDTSSGEDVWSGTITKDLEHFVEIIEVVPEVLTSGLQLRLEPEAQQRFLSGGTTNLEAAHEFLRGRQILLSWLLDSDPVLSTRAKNHLQRAIDLDRGYSRAYSSLAWTLVLELDSGLTLDVSVLDQAEDLLQRAIRFDEANSEAHATSAFVHGKKRRPYESYQAVVRGLTLDPNNETVLQTLGFIYQDLGLYEECLQVVDRIRFLNPNFPYTKSQPILLARQGRFEEAEAWTASNWPDSPFANLFLAIWKVDQKDYRAAQELRALLGPPEGLFYQVVNFLLESALQETPPQVPADLWAFSDLDSNGAYHVAAGLALSDQAERAVGRLRVAESLGFMNPNLLKRASFFDPIRDQSEFQEYLTGLETRRDDFLSRIELIELPALP